jgi:hypothetical protein
VEAWKQGSVEVRKRESVEAWKRGNGEAARAPENVAADNATPSYPPRPPTLLPNAEVQEREYVEAQTAETRNVETRKRLTPRDAPDGTQYAQLIPVMTPALQNCEEQSHAGPR